MSRVYLNCFVTLEAGSPGEPPDKKARLEAAVGPVVTTEGEAVVTRKVDWKGKTYLAPLTTVGNLPFRWEKCNYI